MKLVRSRSMLHAIAACLALFLLSSASAAATPRLDFDIGWGGNISYAGGTNPLVGTNLDVTRIRVTDPESNNGNINVFSNIIGGALSFSTGAFVGEAPLGIGWMFDDGGTVSLTGGVDLNGNGVLDGSDIAAGTSLFAGTFRAGPEGAAALVLPLGWGFSVSVALFSTTIPAALTDFWGITQVPNSWSGEFVLAGVGGGPTGNGGFTSTVAGGGGSVDSGLQATAPEPGSMLLFGTALAAIAGVVRRRRLMPSTS